VLVVVGVCSACLLLGLTLLAVSRFMRQQEGPDSDAGASFMSVGRKSGGPTLEDILGKGFEREDQIPWQIAVLRDTWERT